ncbi:uncharacterized protein LOC135817609 [Sycon ciliatum]|uniref:uncharacterized protein LOC135817609 n=1 Tax=Sycon ciliatum TaxID=27933 RepID=UPI0031F6F3BF
MADKYDLFLVDTLKGEGQKKSQHPWYRERLRTKYLDSQPAMDAKQWTFVNDTIDDFRPDHHPHPHPKLKLLYKKKKEMGPVLLSSSSSQTSLGQRQQLQQQKHRQDKPVQSAKANQRHVSAANPAARVSGMDTARHAEQIESRHRRMSQDNRTVPHGYPLSGAPSKLPNDKVLPSRARGLQRAQHHEDKVIAQRQPIAWQNIDINLTPEMKEKLIRVLEGDRVGGTSSDLPEGHHTRSQSTPSAKRSSARLHRGSKAPTGVIPSDHISTGLPSATLPSYRSPSPGTLPRINRSSQQRANQSTVYHPSQKDAMLEIFEEPESAIRKVTEGLCDWADKLKTVKEETVLDPEDVCKLFAEAKAEKGQEDGLFVLQETALPPDLTHGRRHTRSPAKPREAFPSLMESELCRQFEMGAGISDNTDQACEHYKPRGKVNYGAWYLPKHLWKVQQSGEELIDPEEHARRVAASDAEREERLIGTHTILMRLIAGDTIDLSQP